MFATSFETFVVALSIALGILLYKLYELHTTVELLYEKVKVLEKKSAALETAIETTKEDIIEYLSETTDEKIVPLHHKLSRLDKKHIDLEVLYNSMSMKINTLIS